MQPLYWYDGLARFSQTNVHKGGLSDHHFYFTINILVSIACQISICLFLKPYSVIIILFMTGSDHQTEYIIFVKQGDFHYNAINQCSQIQMYVGHSCISRNMHTRTNWGNKVTLDGLYWIYWRNQTYHLCITQHKYNTHVLHWRPRRSSRQLTGYKMRNAYMQL